MHRLRRHNRGPARTSIVHLRLKSLPLRMEEETDWHGREGIGRYWRKSRILTHEIVAQCRIKTGQLAVLLRIYMWFTLTMAAVDFAMMPQDSRRAPLWTVAITWPGKRIGYSSCRLRRRCYYSPRHVPSARVFRVFQKMITWHLTLNLNVILAFMK